MSFGRYDIDYLVIDSNNVKFSRLDKNNKYGIEYYTNFINKNIQIIGNLIEFVQNEINKISDVKTKERILNWSKQLVKAYKINKDCNPQQDYKRFSNFGAGYYQENPYAAYIEKDFPSKVTSFSSIVDFMNDVYLNIIIIGKKFGSSYHDYNVLMNIFMETKKACQTLGMRSAPYEYFDEAFDNDPFFEGEEYNSILLTFDILVDEDETPDITITSLPYTVTAPCFDYEGNIRTYQALVNKHNPKIYYNKAYIERVQTRHK